MKLTLRVYPIRLKVIRPEVRIYNKAGELLYSKSTQIDTIDLNNFGNTVKDELKLLKVEIDEFVWIIPSHREQETGGWYFSSEEFAPNKDYKYSIEREKDNV